jgi:hypothetical protein
MGALAETIKSAEVAENDAFTTSLTQLMDKARAPVGGDSYKAMQSAGLPTAAEESKRRMLKWVAGIGGGAVAFGALLRMLRSGGESARRKELYEDMIPAGGASEVTIPGARRKRASHEKKAAIWPWALGATALAPAALKSVGSSVDDAWEGGKETVSKGFEHLFQPTGSALTNPWTLPLGFLATIAATYGGYKVTDALISKMRQRRRKRELSSAESEFESALSSQFSGKRASLLARAVDGVAEAYASGELEKQAATLDDNESWWDKARGGGNVATGGYLALLTLLASLGAAGGYHYVKGRETPRRKFEVAKELMLRRRMARPPVVTADVE